MVGFSRDVGPLERQARRNRSQLVNWFGRFPGCPTDGLDTRSLLGNCGQHLALLLTGPVTDIGRVITAVS